MKFKMKKENTSGVGSDNEVVQSIIHMPPSKTDPNGSYTGKPLNKDEKPVQDADDL